MTLKQKVRDFSLSTSALRAFGLVSLTAGLAGLFFLGVFVRRVGGRAAVAGLLLNYAVCFALRYAPLPFERPHVFLVGGAGFAVCVLSAWTLSFVLPREKKRKV